MLACSTLALNFIPVAENFPFTIRFISSEPVQVSKTQADVVVKAMEHGKGFVVIGGGVYPIHQIAAVEPNREDLFQSEQALITDLKDKGLTTEQINESRAKFLEDYKRRNYFGYSEKSKELDS